LCFLGIVVAVDITKQRWGGGDWSMGGDKFEFDLEVHRSRCHQMPRTTIRNGRGDIRRARLGRASGPRLRQEERQGLERNRAHKLADRASVEIVQNGDGYEIHPAGSSDSRLSLDLEVSVPKKSCSPSAMKRATSVSRIWGTPVSINNGSGDIEVRTLQATSRLIPTGRHKSFGHQWQRENFGARRRG